MKDFAKEYLKKGKEDQYTNPLLYTTPEVEEELLTIQSEVFGNLSIANLVGVILTAPIQTIVSSLQLSVKPHKQLYVDPIAKNTKAVAKLNTSLTLQEKRRMELMLRAGGEQKPYVAPVYEGYLGAVKGLAQQGFSAFFKGLAFRSIHNIARFFALSQIGLTPSGHESGSSPFVQLSKIYLLQTFTDIGINFLHIAQNRYILQNNISEFKGIIQSTQSSEGHSVLYRQILKGGSYHIINNIGEIFIKLPLMLFICTQKFNLAIAGMYYFVEILQYPFNTAFRRLLCQHKTIPGMIPIRYSSVLHAVRLIFSEEGMLGLYKGFGLHHMTIGVKLMTFAILHPILTGINSPM